MSCIPVNFSTHSPTIRHAQEGALQIATALSTIVFLGGLFGTLALMGVPLAGLNSLAANMSGAVITRLILGSIALGASVALSLAFMHQLRNRQLSQAEIDATDIGQWYRDNEIEAKLEEGEYWRLPEEHHGFVCYGGDLYVFRKERDCEEKLADLKLRDGKARFDGVSLAGRIPESYMVHKHPEIAEDQVQQNTYICYDLEDGTFGIRIHEGLFFFTEQEPRDALKADRFDQVELSSQLSQIPYLPVGHFWPTEKGFFINTFGMHHFNPKEVPQGYVNARGLWEDSRKWPEDFGAKLADEYGVSIESDAVNPGGYQIEEASKNSGEHPLVLLGIKDRTGVFSLLYLKSLEAVRSFIPAQD